MRPAAPASGRASSCRLHEGQPANAAEQTAARQPEPTQEITVTQVTPDDILNDGGPITPATGDGTPTERQLEQGVVMVNPSVDSMESRG